MSLLRGLIFKACVIPTALAVGYCYIAPDGVENTAASYVELLLSDRLAQDALCSLFCNVRRRGLRSSESGDLQERFACA